jgi:anti-sigma factor ChrR (cupin superfamily)
MITNDSHPDPDTLELLFRGCLEESDAIPVRVHLATCPFCRKAVSEIDQNHFWRQAIK